MVELRALTSLRFLAALYVFAFHVHIRWPIAGSEAFASFLSQGAVGMTAFFMLSGYILAHRYRHGLTEWNDYFVNRLARIYPVYVAAALVTIPWISLPPANPAVPADASLQVGRWILLILADITATQAWLPPLLKYWNNGASWSISAEAFFYAVFPVLLSLISKASLRGRVRWLGAAYVLSFLPAAGYILFDPIGLSAVYYSVPLFRLPEFIAGIAFFHVSSHIKIRTGALEIGLLLIGTSWAWYLSNFGSSLPLYVSHNWINVPFFGAALIVLSRRDSFIARTMSISPAVWAGKISYCFYSFQVLILFLASDHRGAILARFPALNNDLWWTLFLFVLLMGISTIGYHLIEEPCRVKVREWVSGSIRATVKRHVRTVSSGG